jgi:O-antigen/teichoic acid export membrane protein
MTTVPPVSRFGAKRLYRDAGSMASSSIASGILGTAFWALSARLFPPAELGVMTAVMAVITATGVVVAAGVGDAYTALLPAVGSARVRLYQRGQRMFWIIASIGGVGAAAGTVLLLTEVRGSIGVAFLVAIGVLVWSAVNVQSSALVALGRARWLPGANLLTGLVKLGLLPLLAITLHWHAVELAFVIATTGMVVVLGPAIWNVVKSDTVLPPATLSEDAALQMFNGFFAQSIASSGLNFGVLTLSPFLVTAFSDPEQGALFALVFSIVQTLDVIGMAMAISLVVHASSAPEGAWSMARSVLIKTVLLTVAGALFLIILVPPALRLLDPAYGALGATDVVQVLCALCVVRTVYTVWAALQRSRRNIAAPLRFNVAFAVILPVLVVTLCRPYGALGGASALLLAQAALSGAAGIHLLIIHRRGGEGVRRVSGSGS